MAGPEHPRDPDPNKTLYAKWFFAPAVPKVQTRHVLASLARLSCGDRPLYACSVDHWGSVCLRPVPWVLPRRIVAMRATIEPTAWRSGVIDFLSVLLPCIRAYRNGQSMH